MMVALLHTFKFNNLQNFYYQPIGLDDGIGLFPRKIQNNSLKGEIKQHTNNKQTTHTTNIQTMAQVLECPRCRLCHQFLLRVVALLRLHTSHCTLHGRCFSWQRFGVVFLFFDQVDHVSIVLT